MIFSWLSIGFKDTGTKPCLVTLINSKLERSLPDKQAIASCPPSRWIWMHNLNSISHPLDEKLVQARWHTTIGMDPITPKYQVIATLHISDEERRGQSLASNGELHVSNSSGQNRSTSYTADHHVGLDQLLISATELLVKRIRHQVHYRPTVH